MEENGKVFILNCHETDKFSIVSSKEINKDIEYFFEDKFRRLWYWVPERLNQRLTDQDAVFVFGKPEIKDYEYIEVESQHKKSILTELEKFFDYTRKTLFSDKYALGEIYQDFDKDENRWDRDLDEAIEHIQSGNFPQAMKLLGQIKAQKNLLSENKNLFLEAHFQSAFASMEIIKKEAPNSTYENIVQHIKSLDNMDTKIEYIEDLKFCIDNNYKGKKIQSIKEEFKYILPGGLAVPIAEK